jgi:lipopolysaccharide/colanic/teichoic acid biosynthesis glycosyltransferase
VIGLFTLSFFSTGSVPFWKTSKRAGNFTLLTECMAVRTWCSDGNGKQIDVNFGLTMIFGFRSREKLESASLASDIIQGPIKRAHSLARSLRMRRVDRPKDANSAGIKSVPARNRGSDSPAILSHIAIDPVNSMQVILPEHLFLGMLCLERKRAERSRKNFLLLLLDTEDAGKSKRRTRILEGVVRAADASRRDTDPAGWYKHNAILGIIFTELGVLGDAITVKKVLKKVHDSLAAELNVEDLGQVHVSVHIFPDDSDSPSSDISVSPAFYPDILPLRGSKRILQILKRAMDVSGSATALLLFSPLFLVVAAAIKLSSRGPILFQQERLGRFGTTFKCLKFRSMYSNSDAAIHREFVKRVIAGSHDENSKGRSKLVYKMMNDPRVTRIGWILRRTSLDELPQFINVFKGDMSLVGPRPPLAYEFEEYDIWHRRRVHEVMPGITGLWQVNGRSRVGFDDMVRLDLQYARGWSLWLDIKILARTPRAVVFGDGAY